jgi:hypothetical protein
VQAVPLIRGGTQRGGDLGGGAVGVVVPAADDLLVDVEEFAGITAIPRLGAEEVAGEELVDLSERPPLGLCGGSGPRMRSASALP